MSQKKRQKYEKRAMEVGMEDEREEEEEESESEGIKLVKVGLHANFLIRVSQIWTELP